jgi:predicted DsbA family dithiol-disulfide isomerase
LPKVREDIGYASRIGVENPVAIFVNGYYISGTFPYEDLRRLVQQELELKAKARRKD